MIFRCIMDDTAALNIATKCKLKRAYNAHNILDEETQTRR